MSDQAEESDWPRNVRLAANTIGWAAERQGIRLEREHAITIAVYLDDHGLLA